MRDRQTGRQAGRHTDRQRGREAEKQKKDLQPYEFLLRYLSLLYGAGRQYTGTV